MKKNMGMPLDYATMMKKDERFVSKWKVKLTFRGIYRLSGTWIVECLEIIDVGCNLETVWWLDLTDPDPQILQQI